MKRSIAALCIVAGLLTVILVGCAKQTPLENALEEYSQIVAGDFPDDIKLTIYYMDPRYTATRAPWSKEMLMSGCDKKIVVGGEELAPYWEMMKELDASVLEPVQEETYIDAKIYYFLEVGSSEKVLEVIVSVVPRGYSIVVNDIEVEKHPWFYDLIVDFVEAEGCELPNFR